MDTPRSVSDGVSSGEPPHDFPACHALNAPCGLNPNLGPAVIHNRTQLITPGQEVKYTTHTPLLNVKGNSACKTGPFASVIWHVNLSFLSNQLVLTFSPALGLSNQWHSVRDI